MSLFSYHFDLACRSLRRDRAYTVAMVTCLGLVASICATGLANYLRLYGPSPRFAEGLHHVTLARPDLPEGLWKKAGFGNFALASKLTVSYGEYRRLSSSGIPARQTGTFRSRVLVDAPAGSNPAGELVRFVSGDFFGMFARPFRHGGAWKSGQEEGAGEVAVLGEAMNRRLFGGRDSVGQALTLEGRRFRIVGVLRGHQPFRPDWDLSALWSDEDAVYLPFETFRMLYARPEMPVSRSPVGRSFDDLLSSDTTFIQFWVDLPDEARRAAYGRYVQGALAAAGGRPPLVRSFSEWQRQVPIPDSPISFFAVLCFVVLLAGAFNLSRLALAKALARADELGVFRALGASRRAIFSRQLVEGGLISGAGAALGVVLAVPFTALYSGLINDVDIPLVVTPVTAGISFLGTFLVGLLASVGPAYRISRTAPTVFLGRR